MCSKVDRNLDISRFKIAKIRYFFEIRKKNYVIQSEIIQSDKI